MRIPFSTLDLTTLNRVREALADEEAFHVPSEVIEWLDGQIARHEIDIEAWLAERSQIALIWSIEDVREVRPDLNKEQCWQVLEACKHQHDANLGISWEVLRCQAHLLFGPEPSDKGGQP
ncbi:hypothetical protein [Blastopirellula marina]|uniref:Uncharacterized protein n=1 Tax=Blastopirellula marina DSM 3645 TaxID=314230 RepID=A3ZP22_9BACT|nr:hypothetical protein [Blastopirellula marina]EAQ81496.1 hypothetical protein DSM3645_27982 [Blastopirellula marina DSM 3645]